MQTGWELLGKPTGINLRTVNSQYVIFLPSIRNKVALFYGKTPLYLTLRSSFYRTKFYHSIYNIFDNAIDGIHFTNKKNRATNIRDYRLWRYFFC